MAQPVKIWNERSGVQFLEGTKDFFLLQDIWTGSGTNQPPNSMGREGLFLGFKWAEVWSWPLTSNYCRGKMQGSYTSTSPVCFHGTIHGDNFTIFFTVLTCCTSRREWLLSFIYLTVDTLTVYKKVLMWQNIPQTFITIKKLHRRTTKNDINPLNQLIVGSCALRYCVARYVGTGTGKDSTSAPFSVNGGTILNKYLHLQ